MKSMMHIIYIYIIEYIMHIIYIYLLLNIMHTMHRYIYILCKKFDMMGKMPRVAIVKRWGESGSAGEVVVV
jgi:hypothetical protein